MLSKREKEKKFDGQSQHFIYYYYPSMKTHPPFSSPFKSGQESPLLSSPLLCSPPPLCRRFFRSPGLAARSWRPIHFCIRFVPMLVNWTCCNSKRERERERGREENREGLGNPDQTPVSKCPRLRPKRYDVHACTHHRFRLENGKGWNEREREREGEAEIRTALRPHHSHGYVNVRATNVVHTWPRFTNKPPY